MLNHPRRIILPKDTVWLRSTCRGHRGMLSIVDFVNRNTHLNIVIGRNAVSLTSDTGPQCLMGSVMNSFVAEALRAFSGGTLSDLDFRLNTNPGIIADVFLEVADAVPTAEIVTMSTMLLSLTIPWR